MTAGIDTAGTLGRVAGIAGHQDRVRAGLDVRIRLKLEKIEDQTAAALAAARSLGERVAVAVQDRVRAEQDLNHLTEQTRFGRRADGLDELRERVAARTAEVIRLTTARDAAHERWVNLGRLLEASHRHLGLT